VAGAHSRGALVGLGTSLIIPELWLMFQRGAEQGISTLAAVMWQRRWEAVGMRQGFSEQAGGCREVWELVQIVLGDIGAGCVRPSSRRHVLMNASARSRVTSFAGLYTVSACRLQRG
jgi:hypothetical protein